MRRYALIVLSLLLAACATTQIQEPYPDFSKADENRPQVTASSEAADGPGEAPVAMEAVAFSHDDAPPTAADELRVYVVDVGPGLCTVIEAPGPHFAVYDGGHWIGRHCAHAVEQIVGSNPIELLIISHSDTDHFGNAPEILKEHQVNYIWSTGFPRDKPTWKKLHKAISNEVFDDHASVLNLQTVPLEPGMEVRLGPATMTLLAGWPRWTQPGPDGDSEFRNVISIVARLDYGGQSVLLSGDTIGRRRGDPDDACKDAEAWMVEKHDDGVINLDADVIIAPHHGADNGSSSCFIQAVSPSWVVFSAGHSHQHPTKAAAERYLDEGVSIENIVRTDRGDDEPGSFEWKEGAVEGCQDPRGDDDVIVSLIDGQPALVYYLEPSSGC